jgi:hypothetical protein
MKRYFLLLLFTLPLLSSAQDYHPLVTDYHLWSVYHYYCKGDYNPFSQFVRFTGDVTVNDTVYKQIWTSNDTLTEPWAASGLIREDAQKRVWDRSSGEWPEYLRYDFGALPGDTLWVGGNPYPYVMGTIDSVQLLNGEYRKQYHLLYPEWLVCEETWIEGIGCLKGVLESGMCSAVGDDPSLICSLSHDTILFHDPWYPECHLITGLQPPSVGNSLIGVFPNPASGTVTVQLPVTHASGILVLRDVHGRSIVHLPVAGGVTLVPLELPDLPSGVYFMRFDTGSGNMGPVKIFLNRE